MKRPAMRRKRGARPRSSAKHLWQAVPGGVTAPQGYLASGVAAGIKRRGLDLAVVYSPTPASAAAVFTTNIVQAAPVVLSRNNLLLAAGRAQAVLLNSGCANACTGDTGMRDARLCARTLSSALAIPQRHVVVASTGVIGQHLPVPKMLAGISKAASALNSKGGEAAALAIMTTDTHPKSFAYEGRLRRATVRIGGMAKGAGMIHPDLATMLAVITTDIVITPMLLSRIFRRVVESTFNCLTVDGDTSTNDMVVVLANGAAGVKVDRTTAPEFERGLTLVCEELAKSIARDGEGASKFVEIRVTGAATQDDARRAAKAIAHSPLVKTALHGEEANWGRILCAAGYSRARFDPERVSLSLCGVPVYRRGAPLPSSKKRAERALKARDIIVHLDLASGLEDVTVWTCDLTREYVNINASYIS